MTIKIKRLAIGFAGLLVVAICAAVVLEWLHFRRHQHLFPLGLHVDVVALDPESSGEQARLHEVSLRNYGILPARVMVDSVMVAGADVGRVVPYWVQKFDPGADTWNTVIVTPGEEFGDTLSKATGYVVLFPGQSSGPDRIAIEQSALSKGFKFTRGEKARIVYFRGVGTQTERGPVYDMIESSPFVVKQ